MLSLASSSLAFSAPSTLARGSVAAGSRARAVFANENEMEPEGGWGVDNLMEMMDTADEVRARAWAPLPRDVLQREVNAMDAASFVDVGELEGERPAFDEGHDGALRRFSTAIEAVRNDACDAGGPVLLVTHGDCVNAAKYALTDSVEIFDVQECGWVVVGIDGTLLDHGRVQLLQM